MSCRKAPTGTMWEVIEVTGYDKATSWQDMWYDDDDDGIPLSTELRQELEEFLQLLNERLFRLTGKRCGWWPNFSYSVTATGSLQEPPGKTCSGRFFRLPLNNRSFTENEKVEK
jgi:hypothetical protein